MVLWTLLWSVAAALAAPPAHYHPDQVAAASATFGAVAAEAAPAFDAAQAKLAALGRDLEALSLGVELLGNDAPAALQTWAEETRKTVTVQYLQTQKHVDQIQDDYARVFGAALERALATVGEGYDVKECASAGVTAMMRRQTCEGADLNAPLAAALDKDAQLKRDLDDIHAAAWPAVGVSPAPQPAVVLSGASSGEGGWIDLSKAALKLIPDTVKARQAALEEALAPLERDMDQGDQAALAEAQKARAAYERQVAADGAALRAALAPALDRAGVTGVGLCANPAGLGGCPGADRTSEVLGKIAEDRKLQKALEKIQ